MSPRPHPPRLPPPFPAPAGYRAIRLSGYQAIRLSGYRAIGLSGYQAIGLSGYRAIGQSVLSGKVCYRAIRQSMLSGYRASCTIGLSGKLCYRAIGQSALSGYRAKCAIGLSAVICTIRRTALSGVRLSSQTFLNDACNQSIPDSTQKWKATAPDNFLIAWAPDPSTALAAT